MVDPRPQNTVRAAHIIEVAISADHYGGETDAAFLEAVRQVSKRSQRLFTEGMG